MLQGIRRELKDNIGDQLRGIRHLVRALGSDVPDIRVANHSLPPLPPELNRLLGDTFQTMEGAMSALKTIATPFRSCRSSSPGFSQFKDYCAAGQSSVDGHEALTDDLYATLKMVARSRDSNSFVLKSRVAELSRKFLLAAKSNKFNTDPGEHCANLFLLLVQARPIAETNDDKAEHWKIYAAVALAFGLSLSGRLSAEELVAFAQGDAILVASQRGGVFLDAIKEGAKTKALVRTFESLLCHLP